MLAIGEDGNSGDPMSMACQGADFLSLLPVPDLQGTVIRTRDDVVSIRSGDDGADRATVAFKNGKLVLILPLPHSQASLPQSVHYALAIRNTRYSAHWSASGVP